MSYRAPISNALASASVHYADVLIELAKAGDENRAPQRIERLREAQFLATEIKTAIDQAIQAEMVTA